MASIPCIKFVPIILSLGTLTINHWKEASPKTLNKAILTCELAFLLGVLFLQILMYCMKSNQSAAADQTNSCTRYMQSATSGQISLEYQSLGIFPSVLNFVYTSYWIPELIFFAVDHESAYNRLPVVVFFGRPRCS